MFQVFRPTGITHSFKTPYENLSSEHLLVKFESHRTIHISPFWFYTAIHCPDHMPAEARPFVRFDMVCNVAWGMTSLQSSRFTVLRSLSADRQLNLDVLRRDRLLENFENFASKPQASGPIVGCDNVPATSHVKTGPNLITFVLLSLYDWNIGKNRTTVLAG